MTPTLPSEHMAAGLGEAQSALQPANPLGSLRTEKHSPPFSRPTPANPLGSLRTEGKSRSEGL